MSQKYRVHRGITSRVIIVTIALILVAAISFTFAWFSGRFTNEGNIFQTAEPNAQIELSLISQSQVKASDGSDALVWPAGAPADGSSTDGKLTFTTEELAQAGLSNVVLSSYKFPNGMSYQITDAGTPYPIQFLNEKDWLPASKVTKRLIVQGNQINRAVDYNISFAIPGYNSTLGNVSGVVPVVNQEILAEALEVTIYEVTKSGDVETKTVVEGFDGIGGEELARKNLHGILPDGGANPSVTYEISIELANSASYIYSKNLFNLDIKFESYSEVGKTHYVTNANELSKALSELNDYDNIVLRAPEKDGKREIVVENFITDKLFNLRLDDTDLKVTKIFEIQTGNKWGTIDLGMYGSAQLQPDNTVKNPEPTGMLVLPYNGTADAQTTAVVIDTPRAALRYGKIAQLDADGKVVMDGDAPKYLDNTVLKKMIVSTRAINGSQDIKSSAIGQEVTFAGRKWLIADTDNDGVTLMWHDEALASMSYNSLPDGTNAWKDSDIRTYLNSMSADGFLSTQLGITDEATLMASGIIATQNHGEHYLEASGSTNYLYNNYIVDDFVWIPSAAQIVGYQSPDENGLALPKVEVIMLPESKIDILGGSQMKIFENKSQEEILNYLLPYLVPTASNPKDGLLSMATRSPSSPSSGKAYFYIFSKDTVSGKIQLRGAGANGNPWGLLPCVKVSKDKVTL